MGVKNICAMATLFREPKRICFCHSERSEESLRGFVAIDGEIEERFLGPKPGPRNDKKKSDLRPSSQLVFICGHLCSSVDA
jgi:hypothetical protein